MDKLRIRYSKKGKAKYISHLDLMATMQRALIRAGVNLKYSEGFNPHPYISVALPAPVGVDSQCELMDIAISGGGSNDLNRFMPEGLIVQNIYKPWRKFNDIKWLDIEVHCRFIDNTNIAEFISILRERFNQDNLLITKKTKRGISTIDIAPHIKKTVIDYVDENGIRINTRISAQNPTVGGKDIAKVIEMSTEGEQNDSLICKIDIKRIEIYDENMVLFK